MALARNIDDDEEEEEYDDDDDEEEEEEEEEVSQCCRWGLKLLWWLWCTRIKQNKTARCLAAAIIIMEQPAII